MIETEKAYCQCQNCGKFHNTTAVDCDGQDPDTEGNEVEVLVDLDDAIWPPKSTRMVKGIIISRKRGTMTAEGV